MTSGSNGRSHRGRPPRPANKAAGAAVLTAHMESHGLSGADIASSFKVTFAESRAAATVRRWADGINAPSEEDAERLDQILGLGGSLLRAYYPSTDPPATDPPAADPDDEATPGSEATETDSSAGTLPAPADQPSTAANTPRQPDDETTGLAAIPHPRRMAGDLTADDTSDADPKQPQGPRFIPARILGGVAAAVVLVAAVVVVVVAPWKSAPPTDSPTPMPSSASSVAGQGTASIARTAANAELASPTSTVTVSAPTCDTPAAAAATTSTIRETQGTVGASTFTDPTQGCGAGPKIDPGAVVQVVCRIYAPVFRSVMPDGYWYLIATGPGQGRFAPANTFLNGDAPGAGSITNTDVTVPLCESSS